MDKKVQKILGGNMGGIPAWGSDMMIIKFPSRLQKNNNGTPHVFPNTKLIFQCPESTYAVVVSNLMRGRGIMPDYEIIPTVDELVAGKDTVLQFSLKPAFAGKDY